MKWSPTDGVQERVPLSKLEKVKKNGPPCVWCMWWDPTPKYEQKGTELFLQGVICCTRKEGMQNDFGCYHFKG